MSNAINASPNGNIQNPRMGRNPNTPPTMSAAPMTLRTPGGTRRSPHLSVRKVAAAIQSLSSSVVSGYTMIGPSLGASC